MSNNPIAYLKLQPSEATVVQTAGQLLAAYIHRGELTGDNMNQLVSQCSRLAIALAVETNRLLQADDELGEFRNRS